MMFPVIPVFSGSTMLILLLQICHRMRIVLTNLTTIKQNVKLSPTNLHNRNNLQLENTCEINTIDCRVAVLQLLFAMLYALMLVYVRVAIQMLLTSV